MFKADRGTGMESDQVARYIGFWPQPSILRLNFIAESWVGGNVFCQLFAYFSNSLVSFAILAATLATFER